MTIDEYIEAHIAPQGELLDDLERRAHIELMRPRMMSGHLQGRFLKMMCALLKPHRILEIGTYTGYAALCMAEALGQEARLHTIEAEDEIEPFIRRYLDRSPHGYKIILHIANALEILPQLLLNEDFDLVYMDANKREYIAYYDLLIKHLAPGSLILADNTLWDGKVIFDPLPQDAQTQSIVAFNDLIAHDPRVEQVILPLRDGLSLIRVKSRNHHQPS